MGAHAELWAIAGLLCGLVLMALVVGLRERLGRRRGRRRAARGRRLEGEAADALRRLGYRVVEAQPERVFTWWVDGEPREGRLSADYLVSRRGRVFAVEVKSGRSARPESRDTRRQLLDYRVHYGVDGVLLFDAERGALHQVDFDLPRPPRARGLRLAAAFGLGICLGWLLAAV